MTLVCLGLKRQFVGNAVRLLEIVAPRYILEFSFVIQVL